MRVTLHTICFHAHSSNLLRLSVRDTIVQVSLHFPPPAVLQHLFFSQHLPLQKHAPTCSIITTTLSPLINLNDTVAKNAFLNASNQAFRITMEDAWTECKNAIMKAKKAESGNPFVCKETLLIGKQISERCRHAYDTAQLNSNEDTDISDEQLMRLTRFTDGLPLQNYSKMFSLVPELVNIVTVIVLKTQPTSQLK